MRHSLKRENAAVIGQWIGIAALRVITIAISRRVLRRPFITEEENQEDGVEEGIIDKQAVHLSHVTGLIFARTIIEQAIAMAENGSSPRNVARVWHRFCGFTQQTRFVTLFTLKRKRAPFKAEAEQGRLERMQWLRLPDPCQVFIEMKGIEKRRRCGMPSNQRCMPFCKARARLLLS